MSVKYGVSEGITESLTGELIEYSNSDPQIVKFTHDRVRFKDLDSFNKWKTGKTIYTLRGETEKLLGLAWFHKKEHQGALECPFTFAIRIYPPARGKGLSFFLMEQAFANFMETLVYKSSNNKGFWLLTRKDNEFAIKLYQNFGFKEAQTDEDGYILMTYAP